MSWFREYNMGHVTHFHGRTGLCGVSDYSLTAESVSAEQYYCSSSLNEEFSQISNLFEDNGNVELYMPSNVTLIQDYEDKGIFDDFDFTALDATANYDYKESFAAKDIPVNPVEGLTAYKESRITYVNNDKVIEDSKLPFGMGTLKESHQEIKLCDKQRHEENADSSSVIKISSTHSNLHKNSLSGSECVSDFPDSVSFNPVPQFEIKTIETHSNLTDCFSSDISIADATVFAPTIADKVKRGRKRQSDIDRYHEIGLIIQQHEKRKRRKKKTTDLIKSHEHVPGNKLNVYSRSCISESNDLYEENLNQMEVLLMESENACTTDNSCQSSQSELEKSNISMGELPYKNMCAKIDNFDNIKNDFSLISCRNESTENSLNVSNNLPIIKGLSSHDMSIYNNEGCLKKEIPKISLDQSGQIPCEELSSSNVSSDSYGCSDSKFLEPVEISTPELEIECHISSNPEITYLKTDFGEPNIDVKSETSSILFIRSQENNFEKFVSSVISSETSAVRSRHTSTSSADSRSSYGCSARDMCDSKSPASSSNSLKTLRLKTSYGSSSCDKTNRCAINSISENLQNSVREKHVDNEHHQNTKEIHSRSRSPHYQKYDHKSLPQSKPSSHNHRDYRKSRSRSRSRGRKYGPNERSPSSSKNKYHRDHYKAIEERRIIYVGNIPEGYTEDQLKSRFQCFGTIIDAQIKSKNENNSREKSIFGFITFKNRSDAYNAFERGNKEPLWPKFDINFGGRRRFCNGDYTDLDGRVAERENIWYSRLSNTHEQSEGDDFAALLKAEERRLGIKRPIHTK